MSLIPQLIIFRIPQHELEARIDAVDATLVKDTCYKYIYDRCSVQNIISPDNVYNIFIFMTDVPPWRPWAPWRTCLTTTESAAACTGSDYKLHHLSSNITYVITLLDLGTVRSAFKQSDIPT